MKFIELTCYAGTSKRLLLNINNIASIYSGIRYNEVKKEYVPVTVIQEITSADNFWEVTETLDEVIALLRKQNISHKTSPTPTREAGEGKENEHVIFS